MGSPKDGEGEYPSVPRRGRGENPSVPGKGKGEYPSVPRNTQGEGNYPSVPSPTEYSSVPGAPESRGSTPQSQGGHIPQSQGVGGISTPLPEEGEGGISLNPKKLEGLVPLYPRRKRITLLSQANLVSTVLSICNT